MEFSDLSTHKKEVPTATLHFQRFTNVPIVREINHACFATLFTYKGTLFMVIYVYFLELHRAFFLPGGDEYAQGTCHQRIHIPRITAFLRPPQNLFPI